MDPLNKQLDYCSLNLFCKVDQFLRTWKIECAYWNRYAIPHLTPGKKSAITKEAMKAMRVNK